MNDAEAFIKLRTENDALLKRNSAAFALLQKIKIKLTHPSDSMTWWLIRDREIVADITNLEEGK